jgi:hypothetical protein
MAAPWDHFCFPAAVVKAGEAYLFGLSVRSPGTKHFPMPRNVGRMRPLLAIFRKKDTIHLLGEQVLKFVGHFVVGD